MIGLLDVLLAGAATLLLLSDCYKPRNNQKVSDREEASNKEARNSKRASIRKETSEKEKDPPSTSASSSNRKRTLSIFDTTERSGRKPEKEGILEEDFTPESENHPKSVSFRTSQNRNHAATSRNGPNQHRRESGKDVKNPTNSQTGRMSSGSEPGRASLTSSQRPTPPHANRSSRDHDLQKSDASYSGRGAPKSSSKPSSSNSQSMRAKTQKTKPNESTKSTAAKEKRRCICGTRASERSAKSGRRGNSPYASRPGSASSRRAGLSSKSDKSYTSDKSHKSNNSEKSKKSKPSLSPCKSSSKRYMCGSRKAKSSQKRRVRHSERVLGMDTSPPREIHKKKQGSKLSGEVELASV